MTPVAAASPRKSLPGLAKTPCPCGGRGGSSWYRGSTPACAIDQLQFGQRRPLRLTSLLYLPAFFENKAALDKFTSGNFEFSAGAQAVAITLAAGAQAGTTGSGAGASVTKNKAVAAAAYHDGMAVFTIIKGGLMYEVSLAGQKYSYKKR